MFRYAQHLYLWKNEILQLANARFRMTNAWRTNRLVYRPSPAGEVYVPWQAKAPFSYAEGSASRLSSPTLWL